MVTDKVNFGEARCTYPSDVCFGATRNCIYTSIHVHEFNLFKK